MKSAKTELIEALREVNPAIAALPYGRGLSIRVPRTFQRRLEDTCRARGLKITRTEDPGTGDVVTVEVFGFPRRARGVRAAGRSSAPAAAGVLVFEARYSDGDGLLIVPRDIVRALELVNGAVLQARVEDGRLVAWVEPPAPAAGVQS